MIHRVADVDLRRQVEDQLGPGGLEHRGDRVGIADVSDLQGRPLGDRRLRFSAFPVERESITVTRSPRAISASTRFEPMNPAPPVTKQSMGDGSLRGRPGHSFARRYPCRGHKPRNYWLDLPFL